MVHKKSPNHTTTRLFDVSLYSLAIICLVLLFLGGPGYHAARSVKQLWNLGHTPAFGLWTWRLFSKWKQPATWQPGIQFLALLLFILLGAATTEGVQALLTTSRNASLDDAINDAAGGFLAFSFWHWQQGHRQPKLIAGTLLCGALLLGAHLIPLGKALSDEAQARQTFPVLADFESPLELDRFEGLANTHSSIETGKAAHGTGALNITLTTAKYSGISLAFFNGNWQPFDRLVMEIRNNENTDLLIVCRIHDQQHNQQYNDRFNRRIILTPGWNTVALPLSDVRSAPRGREMDMTGISGLGIFSVALPRPRSITLDYIRLVKDQEHPADLKATSL